MNRFWIILLILSGIFYSASAQKLADIIVAAHEHHQALQDSIDDMLMVREAKIFSDNEVQDIIFKKASKGILVREETISIYPETDEGPSGPVSVIELYDGESEWQINAMQGKVQMGGGGRQYLSPTVEYWIDPPMNSKILGSEIIHDRECWVIESTPSQTYNYSRVWLDKEYHLMIRVESWDAQKNPTVIENTDLWYVLDDFAIPSRTLIKKRWQPSMELIMKELQVNEGLPDSLFNADLLELPEASGDSD